MLHFYTAQYNYSGKNKLDITVKGQDPLGKHFAPTWTMVQGFHSKKLSEKKYKKLYKGILDAVPKSIWKKVLVKKRLVLVCFCKKGAFCHRLLLANILTSKGAIYEGELNVGIKKPKYNLFGIKKER
jgi:uncharacterized protein YeaO (DUF488 family)